MRTLHSNSNNDYNSLIVKRNYVICEYYILLNVHKATKPLSGLRGYHFKNIMKHIIR